MEQYPKFAMEINSFIQTRKQAIYNVKGVEQLGNEDRQSAENEKLHPLLQWGSREQRSDPASAKDASGRTLLSFAQLRNADQERER